jgi:hypothetical protein
MQGPKTFSICSNQKIQILLAYDAVPTGFNPERVTRCLYYARNL